ncbi:hypothetical protein O181_097841, partial [Austropuccinia psidii MF-1]|nr:hypothetical protein [Austropuccinia psidii MF-1]
LRTDSLRIRSGSIGLQKPSLHMALWSSSMILPLVPSPAETLQAIYVFQQYASVCFSLTPLGTTKHSAPSLALFSDWIGLANVQTA